jgi:hypothetical protein
MKRSALGIAITLAVLSYGVAPATADIVSINGVTCSARPDDENKIARNQYGDVQLKTAVIGTAYLFCPLPTHNVDVNTIELVYKDPDGAGSGARITSELVSNPDTGSFGTLSIISSNDSPLTGYAKQEEYFGSYALATNSYFVIIALTRNTAGVDPKFRTIRLKKTIL